MFPTTRVHTTESGKAKQLHCISFRIVFTLYKQNEQKQKAEKHWKIVDN